MVKIKLKDIKNIFSSEKTKETKEREMITLNQLIDFLNLGGTDEKELSEATYFACLRVLGESLGKLSLKLMKKDDEKGPQEAREHAAYRTIRYRPNPFMDSTTFWNTVEHIRSHFGNAYVWRDGIGKNMKLWILPNAQVQMYYNQSTALRDLGDIFYVYTVGGKRYILSSDEVLHFKTSTTFDGLLGMSVRDILRTTIVGNNKAQKMLNKMYDNGFTAKAVLQYTGNLNDDNTQTFVENIQNYAEGKISGTQGIIPVPIGSKLEPLNIKLADNEFVELKKYSALQIAAAFGIKPNQINDYSKSSYASAEAQQLAFYVDTLLYILKHYEDELNYKILTDEEIKEGYYFKFNIATLLRADLKTQMDSLSTAVEHCIYTPNEARAHLDMPSKPGGDRLIGNGSMIPVEMMGQQYVKESNSIKEGGG